jgi:hypothetical protein
MQLVIATLLWQIGEISRMRNKKIVEIKQDDDKAALSITVYELTVQQIIDLINDSAVEGKSLLEFRKFLSRHMDKFTSLTIEQAATMAPSELKNIYDSFKEVNSTFFEVAQQAGLINLLSELKVAIVEDFSGLLVASLKLDMAKKSLATDTHSL